MVLEESDVAPVPVIEKMPSAKTKPRKVVSIRRVFVNSILMI